MIDNIELLELANSFPLRAVAVVPMTGIGYGAIFRFNTFYIKMYDHNEVNAYYVECWIYSAANPVFVTNIPYHQFDEFARQVTEDCYLKTSFKITWEDPGIAFGGADDFDGYTRR